MMTDRWIFIRNGERLLWNAGQVSDTVLADLIVRARIVAKLPAEDGVPTAVSLFDDVPHTNILGTSTVRAKTELTAVAAKDVKAYLERWAASRRTAEVAAAREAMAKLSPAERTALHEEMADGGKS